MPRAFIRSAVSSATTGRSGTAGSATTSAGSFRGDEGHVEKLAARFLASPDIYGGQGREAEQSINFVTCHDGFTLNDLVSYDEKHNAENQRR